MVSGKDKIITTATKRKMLVRGKICSKRRPKGRPFKREGIIGSNITEEKAMDNDAAIQVPLDVGLQISPHRISRRRIVRIPQAIPSRTVN